MELVINGYGACVRKKGNRFVIECDGDKKEISSEDVDQIIICDSAMLSTSALACASEKGIDVVVMTNYGKPRCRVIPTDFGKVSEVRRCQLIASQSEEGFEICRSIISAKITNISNLVFALSKTRENENLSYYSGIIKEYSREAEELSYKDGYEKLRGVEGAASSHYFSVLGNILPKNYYQGRRSQHPAADIFNSYLNYCYGILYNEVERACIYAGLDPWNGFMHADRAGRKSFVYDCIEQFRQPVIDRLVITMAVRGRFSPDDTDKSFLLTNSGRRKAAGETIARLDEDKLISGEKTTFRKEIQKNIRSLARSLTENREYNPLIYDWK
ncbi:MAG: CRISPR-associated endonuclease Cas1 [Methanomicrobiaceae archaeon]|nr:CRISPR-associated endonuclease Cas1 [Methanomicrobiaceae archaeon]